MDKRHSPRRSARVRLVGALLLVVSVLMAATGPAGAQGDPPPPPPPDSASGSQSTPAPASVIDVANTVIDAGAVCLADGTEETVRFGVTVPSSNGATLTVTVGGGLPDNVLLRSPVAQVIGDDAFLVAVGVGVRTGPTDPLGPFSYPVDLTFTYTTAAGTTDTLTETFSVVGTIVPDCKAPGIFVPPGVEVAATSPAGAVVTFSVDARDNMPAGLGPVSCTPASGSLFAIGSTRVDCSATDAQGNVGSRSFQVRVVVPPPVISGTPSDITREATGSTTRVSWTNPTAVDHFGAAVPVSCDPQPGFFSVGTVTVTCSASDTYSGTSTSSFTVTVQDTTGPVLGVPGPITVVAESPLGRTVSWDVAAADSVDGSLAATCSPSSPALFPIGDTTVTCTATDRAGNTGTGTFVVTVTDAPPVLNLPGPITAEATGADGAAVTFTASADDTTDGPLPVNCEPASGAVFPLGTTTVACDAIDSFGHRTGGSFTVTVRDTTGPAVSVPAAITVDPTGAGGAVVTWPAVTARDAVSGELPADCAPVSGGTFAAGTTTTITCTAVDGAGNTGSASFTVTVRPLRFIGFGQPVDNGTGTAIVYNTVKGGSTVPLKFEVFAGSVELNSTSVIRSFTVVSVTCGAGTVDAIEEFATTGGTSLRYDTTTGMFIQNWKTPRTPGACLRVTVTTTSGSTLSAFFKLQ